MKCTFKFVTTIIAGAIIFFLLLGLAETKSTAKPELQESRSLEGISAYYDSEDIHRSISFGGEWFINNQNIRFIHYGYNARSKAHFSNTDPLREIGSLWSIAALENFLNDSRYAVLEERGMAYFKTFFSEDPRGFTVLNITPDRKNISIAYSAFIILGLLESDYPDGIEISKGFAEGIMAMQNEDGSFNSYFYSNSTSGTDYYPGEALLALMMYYERSKDEKALEAVRKAFPYYRDYWRKNKNAAFVPWHSRAYNKYFKATGDNEVANFVLEMNDWMLDQYRPKENCSKFQFYRGIEAAVHMEGVVQAYEIADMVGSNSTKCYRNFIYECTEYLISMQMINPEDKFAFGGFPSSLCSGNLRCDLNFHAVMGMMDAYNLDIYNEGIIPRCLIHEPTRVQCIVEHTANEIYPYQPQFNNSGMNFSVNADAKFGKWKSYIDYQPVKWNPGARVNISITLFFSNELLEAFSEDYPIDDVCILLTAERDFDSNGLQHAPWNEKASTLLTSTGLPIRGGCDSAVSRFTGCSYRTPIDIMLEAPISSFDKEDESSRWYRGTINASFDLPPELPPGIYRLRLDYGFKSANRWLNFNGDGIGMRPKNPKDISCIYSPPIAASGIDINGNIINGSEIPRRSYWVLLQGYDSNGYQGVVAQEDQGRVAISPGNIIHDELVLPRFSDKGEVIEYNLEPDFLFDSMESQRDIPWRYDRGEWSARLILPNGTEVDLGSSDFVDKRGDGATTNNQNFTNWTPPSYGKYTLQGEGWIEDLWGNRYEGGGNYSFWIAKRLTLGTSTFPGQPYQVGDLYGRTIGFFPGVPANVTIIADLFVNSDPDNVRTVKSAGNATFSGVYGGPQGMKYLPLNASGEYRAKVTATYWDPEGHLWVAVMTHAGVVYPKDTPIIAHGKKLLAKGMLVDRGEQRLEGYVSENGTVHADYMNYPYNSWDCMLIASDQQGANMIVPALTYQVENMIGPSDQALQQPVGRSNMRISTGNGLSPQMFPEFITDMNYYYASGVRPGFVARFVVAEDNATGLSWPTSTSNFGGQYGASNNGEMPGVIYRLLGGVVLRPMDLSPEYAGYQASAFILPKGTNNNRVIGPGDEDLPSPDGKPAHFFLVPVRAGSVYEAGSSFPGSLQIDPIVPCEIQISLVAPNGSESIAKFKGDSLGYASPKEKWILDQPGVWTYNINATWNGHPGRIPGLPEEGEYLFVLEKGESSRPGLTLNLSSTQTFSPISGLEIHGNSSGSEVYYTAITPGAILDQGILPVVNGEFTYKFDPIKMADKIKIYDVMNLMNGKPEIGRIVHLTFFSKEKGSNSNDPYHSFARVILRGTTALYVKGR